MPKLLRLFAAILLLSGIAHAQAAKPDPHSPENAARTALIDSLNRLAAQQTAARRARIAKITTAAEARSRQAQARAAMLRLIGPLPVKTPLNPQVLGEATIPGAKIQKILFESQPSFPVTALLYLPDPAPKAKLPAILMAPGHSPAGKAGDFAFAAAFARAGFAVLSYDPIGQGERLQYPDPGDPTKSLATRPTGEHGEAGLQPVLIGESVAKYFLWDGIRAVDYLETRPEIDPSRIGAFGCSGGGAMTALLGALEPRLAAIGTACYLTSFDALLSTIGPQDGEQSTPGWLAAGQDFPDYVEVAAPKPYAIIATESDMFPFTGAQATEAESRQFYTHFGHPEALHFIHGPGGHGNLRPILPQILQFFTEALKPGALSFPGPPERAGAESPQQPREAAPAGALQVTKTGQVATSYPSAATVFTLNLSHANTLPPRPSRSLAQLQRAIRETTGEEVCPALNETAITLGRDCSALTLVDQFKSQFGILPPDGFGSKVPKPRNGYPAVLLLRTSPFPMYVGSGPGDHDPTAARESELARQGRYVNSLPMLPAPAGSEELKSPILGPYYLLSLRAELTGRTLLGLRIDQTLRAVEQLAKDPEVDPRNITAEASGHEALVLLHAAVLDPRLKHITLHDLPETYAQLLANPLPKDVPQDILPGVLLYYDIPDLIQALGSRVSLK